MTKWTPQLEKAIRDTADYFDAQTREILDTTKGNLQSTFNLMARMVNHGTTATLVIRESGIDYKGWKDAQKLIDLAKANNSDAADKLEKMLPYAHLLNDNYKGPKNPLKMVSFAKDLARYKGLDYK